MEDRITNKCWISKRCVVAEFKLLHSIPGEFPTANDLFPAAIGILEHYFKFAFKENADSSPKSAEIKRVTLLLANFHYSKFLNHPSLQSEINEKIQAALTKRIADENISDCKLTLIHNDHAPNLINFQGWIHNNQLDCTNQLVLCLFQISHFYYPRLLIRKRFQEFPRRILVSSYDRKRVHW